MSRNKIQNNGGSTSGKFTMKMQKKLVVLFFLVLLAFLGLGGRLVYINKSKGEEYTKQVLSQQRYESRTLPYKRGDILDARGTKLAISEKVYNLVVDCKAILAKEDYMEPTMAALAQCFPGVNRASLQTYINENPSRRYYVVDRQLTYDEISDFLEIQNNKKENPNVTGVWFEEEYKRVYPNGSLASDVVGFTIKDDMSEGFKGNYGLEAYYNDVLNGTNGREYGYLNEDSTLERTTIPATDGYSLVTTIDANIQSIIERHLQEFNEKNKNAYRDGNGAANVGCVVMDVDSGEVLGMANYPKYNLNEPSNIEALVGSPLLTAEGKPNEEIPVITADNIEEVLADTDIRYANLNALWKNFCISNTYEPGSTAKAFTIAAGLESGEMTGEEYYTCNGALKVGNYTIKCHNYAIGGDGTLSVKESLEQSCNVALMLMGQQMGKNVYLEYQDRFNFGLRTNIDLDGESRTRSLVFNDRTMGPVELATATFGQGYNVTMIQMMAGFCSLINGGYYYEPHVVSKITTSDGALVKNIEPRLLKQTISESTSEKIREYCQGVVDNGTGKTARPAGYRIGGKTGTAEVAPRDKRNYVVSFMGYAPADNPQIAIYVVVDRPNTAKQDNARYATTLVRSILTEVLPYENIFMTEELSENEKKELEELEISLTLPPEGVSDNDLPADSVSGNETQGEGETITDANGGDITSSFTPGEDEGSTAPLTGAIIDPETGASPENTTEDEDSPE